MFRIEPDRFVIILDRPVVIALARVCDTPVGKGIGMFRIEPDRFVIILDRPVVIALARVCDTPVGKGIGMFRIEPDRLIVVLDRPVVFSLDQVVFAYEFSVFRARRRHDGGDKRDCESLRRHKMKLYLGLTENSPPYQTRIFLAT